MVTRYLVLAVVSLILMGGCADPEEVDTAQLSVDAFDEPKRFEAPKGQVPSAEAEYPPAPWGYAIGSVLPDFAFVGYAAPEGGDGELGVVRMSDFYNPSRAPTRPLALVVEYTSLHCLHHGVEAFARIDEDVRDRGGELLLALSWGNELGGDPATLAQLDGVVAKHDLWSPAVVDPGLALEPVLHPNGASFALIDTTDMAILDTSWGYPGAPFWATFDSLLED